MSNDLNSCTFIGRLGADPEARHAPSGDVICGFSIAVGSQWKDKTSGEKRESTEWVNVTAFGKLGEICSQYLRKGSQIYLEGRMKTEKYQAKDGTDRYSTKIIADKMQMLGGKPEGGGSSVPAENKPAGTTSKPGTRQRFDNFDDIDSIPF